MTSGCPLFISIAIAIGTTAYTEPTERSNSPDIIRRVIPIATIPNSEAIVKIEARLSMLRNRSDKTENKMKKTTIPTIAPNSFIRGNLIINDLEPE
jgi:hypothetical protein